MKEYFCHGHDLSGEPYRSFIAYALKNSDALLIVDFAYTDRNWPKKKSCKQILKQLQPYRLKKRNNAEWPNMTVDTSSEYGMGNSKYTIMVYRTAIKLYDALIEPGNLFRWNFPYYPMDLCFFKNNRCWFASIAHEECLWLYTDSKEQLEKLRQMGIPFDNGEEIDENALFFEESHFRV